MTTQAESAQHNHRRAVRFFWAFLIGASTISLIGNVAHAVLPYIPHLAIQIGAAAVPPIALLAAVHGIALGVRAGASGRIYAWAVVAVSAIGVGAFMVSFLALRDLMHSIGYSPATAWIFPAIIDTTVAVSTTMLVALGDRPAGRSRAAAGSAVARAEQKQGADNKPTYGGSSHVSDHELATRQTPKVQRGGRVPAPLHSESVQTAADSTQLMTDQVNAHLAAELRSTGITTQPVETVVAVLRAWNGGATINAAAKACGVNYRTAQRIVEAARARQDPQLAAIG